MKKMIVLMGGQGVGKGTFAKMLRDINNFKIIETGAILRETAKTDKKIEGIITRGDLVPNEILLKIIQSNIKINEDIILDGFPRNLDQAHWLINTYADKFNIHVIYLDVPKEIMIKRIQKRILEGSGRKDDANEESIKNRLDIFWNNTMPVIQWLETVPDIKFSQIDVSGELNDNFNKIMKAL